MLRNNQFSIFDFQYQIRVEKAAMCPTQRAVTALVALALPLALTRRADTLDAHVQFSRVNVVKKNVGVLGCVGILLLSVPVWAQVKVSAIQIYNGTCDASAAVALNDRLFISASDEDSVLRVYQRSGGNAPVQRIDIAKLLRLDRSHPETDIEGAARLESRVFWIGSHSRSREGKERENRHRFFATSFEIHTNGVKVRLVGRPYKRLLDDLIAAPSLRALPLKAATRLAPDIPGGLNIEGLCAYGQKQLLIGFRNPVVNGRALLVPLENPDDVIAGRTAKFGEPIRLDLDGLGIRDIANFENKYLIIAGDVKGDAHPELFVWNGDATKPTRIKHVALKGLHPEAVVLYPDTGFHELQLFSDDGSRRNGATRCKDERNPAAKHFRSVRIEF